MAQYRALVGMDYPPDRRVEAGEVVSDIPSKSVKWLLEQGYVEMADGSKKAVPAVESPADEDGE